jgi:hypothetical protein
LGRNKSYYVKDKVKAGFVVDSKCGKDREDRKWQIPKARLKRK